MGLETGPKKLMKSDSKRALLVLGMHRSGTSAVAGAMVQLGAAPPLTLMPAHSQNERGYWESLKIVGLDDELLASAGSAWDDWRAFDTGWYSSPLVDGFRRRAKQLLEEEFDSADLFVLKDPRICRILPFWSTALREMNTASLVVIPIRSPLEVARSLASRDGFSLEKSLLIWLRHVLDAERETRHLPRTIVAMDDFLDDWRSSIQKIGRLLGIEWPRLDDSTAAAVDNFLSWDLKHQNASSDSLPLVFAWTLKAYDAVSALSDQPQSRLALSALDEVRSTFEMACAFMGPAFTEIEAKVARAESGAAALRGERNELTRRCHTLTRMLTQMKQQRNRSYEFGLADRQIDPEANRERARIKLHSIRATLAGIAVET
jgi:hypothetical protein